MDATATGRAVAELVARMPSFHEHGTQNWSIDEAVLRFLANEVRAGDRTLETGCGASTVVFAAAGADHTVISPDPDEHERVKVFMAQAEISSDRVRFVAATSSTAFAKSVYEPGAFDLGLIDGRHAFPTPVVDFQYVGSMLRVGGILTVDVLDIPSVQLIHRHCSESPDWAFLGLAGSRAGLYRKLADERSGDGWVSQPFNARYPKLSYLPPAVHVRLIARRCIDRIGDRLPAPALASVRRRKGR